MSYDWRLDGYFDYLIGCTFVKKEFHSSNSNDHEHCVFCWLKITDIDVKEKHISYGYVTIPQNTNQENWVCPTCFNDFKKNINLSKKSNKKLL